MEGHHCGEVRVPREDDVRTDGKKTARFLPRLGTFRLDAELGDDVLVATDRHVCLCEPAERVDVRAHLAEEVEVTSGRREGSHVWFDEQLDELDRLYHAKPKIGEVFIYRGPEGWKNYMRDMLRVGEPAYFIAAKGGWLNPRVRDFFPTFYKEAVKVGLPFFHLFDWEVQEDCKEILKYIADNYRFLPKRYSTIGAVDIFGDHVNILSDLHLGGFDEDFSFTVIVNPVIAESFRTWFRFMWDHCPASPNEKISGRP